MTAGTLSRQAIHRGLLWLGLFLENKCRHTWNIMRMVAVYVIGYSITSDWLQEHSYLEFAEGASSMSICFFVVWGRKMIAKIGDMKYGK